MNLGSFAGASVRTCEHRQVRCSQDSDSTSFGLVQGRSMASPTDPSHLLTM